MLEERGRLEDDNKSNLEAPKRAKRERKVQTAIPVASHIISKVVHERNEEIKTTE